MRRRPPEEFQPRNEIGIEGGKWNVQAGEESGDLSDVVHLTPTSLDELPAPVEAHGEQKMATADRTSSRRRESSNGVGASWDFLSSH